MKTYQVSAGQLRYLMRAPNIQAASQFVRHWYGVRIERINYPFNPRPQWRRNLPAPTWAEAL